MYATPTAMERKTAMIETMLVGEVAVEDLVEVVVDLVMVG